MLILKIKSKLRKYLPDFIYNFVYKVYKYFNYYILGQSENIDLISFTKPVFKKVELDGVSFYIKIDPNNGLVDKEIYSRGIWEPEILAEISRHIKTDSICLDVGANIGQHSLYMASIAREGKVYAFEPLVRLAEQIRESVKQNNFKNVEVLQFGLSNKNAIQKIYLDNLNIGRTTFDERSEASSVETAELKVFDEYWQDKSKIDFIKMDVEGYEYYAMLGMKNILSSYHPALLVEFTPVFYEKMGVSSKEILEYIFSFGYKIYDLEQNKKEILPADINEFLNQTKIQTNILCLQ
jgi:FkbM family methyltransferase